MRELVRVSLSVDSLDGRRVAVVVDHIEMRHCTDTLGSERRNMWAVITSAVYIVILISLTYHGLPGLAFKLIQSDFL